MNDDQTELNQLIESNRERLKRMVRLRIDQRLKGRVDESDVIQEACIEAAERHAELVQQADCSPYVWLRFLTLQKLQQFHRRHIKVQARSVKREQQVNAYNAQVSSVILAQEFTDHATSPVEAVLREEKSQQVAKAIDSLNSSEREILAMRHYEQLTNQEVAEALGIETATAYKRYIRALKKLRDVLAGSDSDVNL